MKYKSQKGFTFIELILLIAIVSILSLVLFVWINPRSLVQKGRDAKRLQDLDTLVKAINLALADGSLKLTNTTNCTTCTSSSGSLKTDGSGYVLFTLIEGKPGLSKYISTLPIDPVNKDKSVYTFGSDGTNFEVDALLEHPDNAATVSTDGGNNPGVYEVGTSLTIIN